MYVFYVQVCVDFSKGESVYQNDEPRTKRGVTLSNANNTNLHLKHKTFRAGFSSLLDENSYDKF